MFKGEINTFKYKAEEHDVPFTGYHAVGVEGPNARAKFGVSTNGINGMVQLSGGKITNDVGYVTAELNPNLTTGVSCGRDGIDTRFAGSGISISSKSANIHTPIGSFGVRFK